MKSKTKRDTKSLPAKLPAGGVSSFKTTSQLDSFPMKKQSNKIFWKGKLEVDPMIFT